eukprot:CAMPEP_0184007340 /NCGR_PEP_ID=MMETSP0954-20121128/1268_1 /TAXON_ID=627963 /ORGANISM="Aplanochytrium sp, Strain PBS07" /LENGTH=84 /DNA_ID=CAMNT_0026286137 /DNA_START=74 /DNA_END=328 /DNA_ORIENTATION=-
MKLLEDDLLERKRISEATRKKRKVNWYLLSPLLFAPALPLIRISLRRYPKIRDRAFKFTLASAFIHGTALLLGVYNNDPNATED